MKKSSTTLTVGHLQYHPITSSTPTTTETWPLTDTFINGWMFLVAPRWNPDWASQGGKQYHYLYIYIYVHTYIYNIYIYKNMVKLWNLHFSVSQQFFSVLPYCSVIFNQALRIVQAPRNGRTLEKQCSQCRFRCSEAPTMMGPPRHTISFSSAEWSRIASAQSLEPG